MSYIEEVRSKEGCRKSFGSSAARAIRAGRRGLPGLAVAAANAGRGRHLLSDLLRNRTGQMDSSSLGWLQTPGAEPRALPPIPSRLWL